MSKISKIRNIVAKTILMVLGSIVIISVFWGYILQGFNLNDSPIKEWNNTDTILVIVSFVLMIGAAYYNKILDILLGLFEKIINKK